jgi:hypothetical protein
VKFPTGGDSPRAPLGTFRKGLADTGEIPGPTVKVRMEENQPLARWASTAGIALGPLLKCKGWFHD